MLNIICFYLDGSDGTLTGVHIGFVVHRRTSLCLQVFQHLRQFVQRLSLQTGSQFGVLRHGRQLIALQHGLDIQSCSTAENRPCTTLPAILIDIEEVLLLFKEIILCSWLADVDEVIGDGFGFMVHGFWFMVKG